MDFEPKFRHKRDESLNSSLSIVTFGPKTVGKNSVADSDKDTKAKSSVCVGSLITLIGRQSRYSSEPMSNQTCNHSHTLYISQNTCKCDLF